MQMDSTPEIISPDLAPSSDDQPSQPMLFVGDLSRECSELDLLNCFEAVGKVESVDVKRSKATRRSLGYGFVRMATMEDAHKAILNLNGMVVKGRPIRIGWGTTNCYLHLENLSPEVTAELINDAFRPFGSLQEKKTTIELTDTRASAVVNFNCREGAETAKRTLHGTQFMNRMLKVEWARGLKSSSSNEMPAEELMADSILNSDGSRPVFSIHVQFEKQGGGVTTNAELYSIFAKYGHVTEVHIKNSFFDAQSGNNRGYAFIHFDTTPEGKKSALKAVEIVSNITLDGLFLFAEPSKNFKKHLQQHKAHPSDPYAQDTRRMYRTYSSGSNDSQMYDMSPYSGYYYGGGGLMESRGGPDAIPQSYGYSPDIAYYPAQQAVQYVIVHDDKSHMPAAPHRSLDYSYSPPSYTSPVVYQQHMISPVLMAYPISMPLTSTPSPPPPQYGSYQPQFAKRVSKSLRQIAAEEDDKRNTQRFSYPPSAPGDRGLYHQKVPSHLGL